MKLRIVERALRCIDEIYPYDASVNVHQFPLEEFVDEAARRILLSAPLHAISLSKSFDKPEIHDNSDGSGYIHLPVDFLRLHRFKMKGWSRPVLEPITDSNPNYKLQFNIVTRGGTAKPVVALTNGQTMLEYYSVLAEHVIETATYIPFSGVDENYPEKLIESTAWLLASIVLSVSNDIQGSEQTSNRANELISIL